MKETFYFSHDYNAQNDEKILEMMATMGWDGYGLYWGIVERLYEADGYLKKDYKTIAFGMRTEYERIKRVVEDFDLFALDDKRFYSKTILERLKLRKEKSDKARKSVMKRWDNTNVLRTQNDSNTIKERKGKEIINYKNLKKPFKDYMEVECKDKTIARRYFGKWVDNNDVSIVLDVSYYKELQ